MTTYTRNILACALMFGFAVSAAAQSANRTSSGVPAVPQAATAPAPEAASTASCRAHCGALAAATPQQPHRNVAENQAQASACLRQMSK